jgi:DNA-binding XRE family transcriptional regulator
MPDAEVASHQDRRQPRLPYDAPGRRWEDDPDLTAVFNQAMLDLGRVLYALRERQDWSQEKEAAAAGLHRDTVSELERAQGDPHLSTIVRLFYVHGFRFAIELRATAQPLANGYNPQRPVAGSNRRNCQPSNKS